MGAGIAASPHCAERRICRCSVYLVPLPERFGTPLLDPGSPAQASLSIVLLPRERSPDFYSTAPPEGSLVFRCPACPWRTRVPGPKSVPSHSRSVKTVRCSAALLGETSLASRFAHLGSEEPREPRRARGHFLFRRLFPAGPRRTRKSFPFLPAEIGSSVPSSPFLPLPAFRRETGPSAPIT